MHLNNGDIDLNIVLLIVMLTGNKFAKKYNHILLHVLQATCMNRKNTGSSTEKIIFDQIIQHAVRLKRVTGSLGCDAHIDDEWTRGNSFCLSTELFTL